VSSSLLVALVVVVPLLSAGVLAALGHFVAPRVDNAAAIAVSAAVTVFCVLLIFRSSEHTIHYWFGGWKPRGGLAIGISFSVDPLSAAIAALIGVLMTAALVQTLDYFEDAVPQQFHVLLLVFLAAMVGFTLSSDLFNMFVFFELMSVAAYALTGYRIEHRAVLQGAINFAVVNSIGAFMLLTGIALLYGRTGALNLAQIGQVLARHHPDGLVIFAFTLVVVGFLTKAGAVPFHFWLGDAYSVAPAPGCILFAGVMSDLGLHAVARVYWLAFSGTLGGAAVRDVLIGLGIVTALLGGVMAFLQASLKRMLAFVVIADVGVFLCAVGLLTADGLAAATVYVVADGLVKGSLFCAVAHLARRTGHTHELKCHGLGRQLPVTGAVVALGGLGLASIPPFGTFLAQSLVVKSAGGIRFGWLPPVLIVATALTGAAVLRAAGRIFLGLGPTRDDLLAEPPAGEEEDEGEETGRHAEVVLWAPAVALLVAGLGLAFTPGLAGRAIQHAEHFVDRPAVARETLHEITSPPRPVPSFHPNAGSYAYGAASALAAILLAWLGLYRQSVPLALRRTADRALGGTVKRLKLLHDGVTGDYVTWLTVGAAVLGGIWALTLTR
jgi:multicomponent Na+:H+ antiporter subunit D